MEPQNTQGPIDESSYPMFPSPLNFNIEFNHGDLTETPSCEEAQEAHELLLSLVPRCFKTLTVQDFMTLDESFSYQEVKERIQAQSQQSKDDQAFLSVDFVAVLFFLIKRQTPFDSFLEDLDEGIRSLLSPSICLSYLLENSTRNFRMFLFGLCSQFMPVPIRSTYCFDEGNLGRFNTWEEAAFVFERFKSLASFDVFNSKYALPTRSVELLNRISGTSFMPSEEPLLEEGNLYMELGMNQKDIEYKPVFLRTGGVPFTEVEQALVSGTIDFVIINFFLATPCELDDMVERATKIAKANKKVTIYCLIQEPRASREPGLPADAPPNLKLRKTREFRDLTDNQRKRLVDQCWTDLSEFFLSDPSAFKEDLKARTDNKLSLLKMFQRQGWLPGPVLSPLQTTIEDAWRVLRLVEKEPDPKASHVLPMNFFQRKITRLKKLETKYGNEGLFIMRDEARKLQQTNLNLMKEIRPTNLVDLFVQIIEQDSLLHLNYFFTAVLKAQFEHRIRPIREQRERFLLASMNPQNQAADRERQEEIFREQEEDQLFSLEHIPRELNYLSEHTQNLGMQVQYLKYIISQIQSAQPIEFIDGDNLHIADLSIPITELSQQKVLNSEDEVFVVSIIGPQSSGKSLLLKYLFGTQFVSSQGRCTKGVYLSFIKLRTSSGDKKILLLDTEGIQSAEARERAFDTRIVFYVLCMSHLVLVCNQGEMNKQMTQTLRLAVDNWAKFKVSVVAKPKVVIIQNKLNEINQLQLQAARHLANEELGIIEMQQAEDERKLDLVECFGIPIFYTNSEFGPQNERQSQKQVWRTSREFRLAIDNLLSHVKNQFALMSDQPTTLKKWLEDAKAIWEQTHDFNGIFVFENLIEKHLDQLLVAEVHRLADVHLNYEQTQSEAAMRGKLQEIIDENEKKFEVIDERLTAYVNGFYASKVRRAKEEFEVFCLEREVNSTLREKRKLQLDRSMEASVQAQLAILRQLLQERLNYLAQQRSSLEYQERANKLLQLNPNRAFNAEEARREFEMTFSGILVNMKERLRNPKHHYQVEELIRNHFYMHMHTLERCDLSTEIGAYQTLRESLPQTKPLKDSMMQEFFSNSPLFLVQGIKPSQDDLIGSSKANLEFLKLPKGLFSLYEIRLRFNLLKMMNHLPMRMDRYGEYTLLSSTIASEIYSERSSKGKVDIIRRLLEEFSNELMYLNLRMRNFSNPELKQIIPPRGYMVEEWVATQLQILLTKSENFAVVQDSVGEVRRPLKFLAIQGYIDQKNFQSDSSEQIYIPALPYNNGSQRILKTNPKAIPEGFFAERICEYLETLIGGGFMSKATGYQEVAKLLDMRLIFERIEDIVVDSLLKNGGQNFKINQILEILGDKEGRRKETLKFIKNITSKSPEVCQVVMTKLNALIKAIDQDLRRVMLRISELGQSLLFTFATVLMVQVWTMKEDIEINLPLIKLMENKQAEKELFVADLTCNDTEADSKLAATFSQKVIKEFLSKQMETAKRDYALKMKEELGKLEKADKIFEIEMQTQNIAISVKSRSDKALKPKEKEVVDQMVQYYLDPVAFLQSIAKVDFDKHKQTCLTAAKSNLKDRVRMMAENLKTFLLLFKESLSYSGQANSATSLFRCHDPSATLHASPASLALAQYFVLFVKGEWPESGTIIKADNVNVVMRSKLPSGLAISLSSEARAAIPQIISKNHKIRNISSFLEKACSELDVFLTQENSALEVDDLDLQNAELQDLQKKYIGCLEVCPLCRRQCDASHEKKTDEIFLHTCQTGHQIKGFGGNKHYQSNEAITWSCQQSKDEDDVYLNGERMKFKDVKNKEQYLNWDWGISEETEGMPPEDRRKLLEFEKRTRMIWNFIGEKLCEEYNKKNLGIKFVPAVRGEQSQEAYLMKKAQFEKEHFILILDFSLSMTKEGKTENVKKGVKAVIEEIQKKRKSESKTKGSIITFNSEAEVVVDTQDISMDMHSKLLEIKNSYGTDFTKPLQQAYQLCEKDSSFSEIIIFFMSDGIAPYPEDELKKFKESPFFDKIKFTSVGFQTKTNDNMLKAIANEMKGTFQKADDGFQLKESMMNVVMQLNSLKD